MSAVLSDTEVQQALQRLPGWKKNGSAIERHFQFPDFVKAMDFVNQIAEAAEAVNHHPDIHISYNKVTLALVSHDVPEEDGFHPGVGSGGELVMGPQWRIDPIGAAVRRMGAACGLHLGQGGAA